MKVKRLLIGTVVLILISASAMSVRAEEAVPALISVQDRYLGTEIVYDENVVERDVTPQTVDGLVMVPLRAVAEALDFKVLWNGDTASVELIRGAQFTSIHIGENSYYKNRMAAFQLSAAPTIVEDRTMVPVEFITEILDYGVAFENGGFKIYDEPFTTLTGYILEITEEEDYRRVFVAPRMGDDVELWEQTLLIVSEDTINNYGPLTEGAFIHGVHLPVMTMSIPGQTSATIIY